MLCPIIVDWFNTSVDDDLIAFASGDYSEATGLTGNTTTKYLRPSKGNGLGLASFTSIDNVHMAVYVRTGSDESSYACGYASAGNVTCGMPISFAGNTYIEISLANDPVADSSGVGFYLSTRLISGGTTNRVTYKNGTSIVSSAVNTGNLGSGAFVVHAFNSAGVITAWTSRAQSFYAVGYGIPVAKVAPYRLAVRTVQVTMARNVE